MAICVLLRPAPAAAITGPASTEALSLSVVAVGTLPVACGAPFAVHCSGVVIDPRLVLTAAHCLPGLRTSGRPQVLARGPANSAQDHEIVGVTAARSHPSYTPDGRGLDLAILTLARPLTAPPARLSAQTFDVGLVGSFGTIQGFGVTEVGGSTHTAAAVGQVVFTWLNDEAMSFAPYPNMCCEGDSGGALFVATPQGSELTGIISQGDPSCQSWGHAARLDMEARDFVDSALAASATPPTDPVSPAPSGQRPPDDSAAYSDLCSKTCDSHLDCPEGAMCLSFGGPRRCVPAGLLPGQLAGSCEQSTAACGSCVQIQGRQSQCACYTLCPPDPGGTPAGGCSLARSSPGEGGPIAVAIGGALALLALLHAGRSTVRSRRPRLH